MLLELRNWSLGGYLLILSNFFTQANCCEETTPSSYLLATGRSGQNRLELIHECYAPISPLELFPPLPNDAKILSVGCGTGTRECQMALHWPHAHITAIDNSEAQLKLARERATNLGLTNIDFVLGDANSLPYINCYDLVYARLVLMHTRNASSILKGMVSAAKSSGRVICEELSSSSFFCKPENQFYKKAVKLTHAISKKMSVDYDIGRKLSDLMKDAGLTSVELNQLHPDSSDLNVKMQYYLGIAEAKPNLCYLEFEEYDLDSLLAGMLEFAKQEDSQICMSDLFKAVGYKP